MVGKEEGIVGKGAVGVGMGVDEVHDFVDVGVESPEEQRCYFHRGDAFHNVGHEGLAQV